MLMVLAVAVLLTTVLARLAKTSLKQGLAAADAQVRLQQRWGSESLQQAVLPRAGKVFKEFDEQWRLQDQGAPPTTIRDAITLGRVTFDVVLGDEDAKLNLNAVYRLGGERRTQAVLQKLVRPELTSMIRLAPAVDQQTTRGNERTVGAVAGGEDLGDDAPLPDAFRSWGEVFDVSQISAAFGNDAALANLTTGITCWGSGQSNLRRASDEIIQAMVASVVSEAQASRLVARYRENPTMSAQILFQNQVSDETQRAQLSRMFSETSHNHSMWIDASATGRRSLRRFIVMQRDDSGMTRYHQFKY
ncbi:General secretion pathway protein K [Stieleria varia]|uniref:General secretion pathway protein K n=1 Tax=Stieleria varia TaxID=2528005 RepID=A0A5C6AH54_9BACT|nr:General secretion pathway protein K [Stieleria varia]